MSNGEGMSMHDIRWIQRFANYKKALEQLTRFIERGELNEFEEQGLIQAFEYTHELAWKTLKDFLENKGNNEMFGSKDATREAFKLGLIVNGDVWMNMINDRNQTTHTYNEETTQQIASAIRHSYYSEFIELLGNLQNLSNKETNI